MYESDTSGGGAGPRGDSRDPETHEPTDAVWFDRQIDYVWRACGGGNPALYFYLRRRANGTGRCWPSIATIARDLDVHRRTAQRAIARLSDAGLIRVEHDEGAANVYVVLPLPLSRRRGGVAATPRVGGVDAAGGVASTPRGGGVDAAPNLAPRDRDDATGPSTYSMLGEPDARLSRPPEGGVASTPRGGGVAAAGGGASTPPIKEIHRKEESTTTLESGGFEGAWSGSPAGCQPAEVGDGDAGVDRAVPPTRSRRRGRSLSSAPTPARLRVEFDDPVTARRWARFREADPYAAFGPDDPWHGFGSLWALWLAGKVDRGAGAWTAALKVYQRLGRGRDGRLDAYAAARRYLAARRAAGAKTQDASTWLRAYLDAGQRDGHDLEAAAPAPVAAAHASDAAAPGALSYSISGDVTHAASPHHLGARAGQRGDS